MGLSPCAGLAELADAMDSKSIARKGVPVRLRDPVLTPDEILGFVGGFSFLAPFLLEWERAVRRVAKERRRLFAEKGETTRKRYKVR